MKTRLHLALLLWAAASAAGAACLKYEPDTVTLAGRLHRGTFPGSPNFESIAAGDEAETGYYLTLDAPICTQADSADREAHEGVREVQLVLTEQQYAALRPELGKQVRLKGQLYSAFSGHHHAPLLLRVKQ